MSCLLLATALHSTSHSSQSTSSAGDAPVIDSLDCALDRLSGDASEAGEEVFDEDGVISDDGNTVIDFVGIGDCLNDADIPVDATTVASLDVVDCDEPHDSEVYAFADYGDIDFPGEDELYDIAEEGCFDLFESYVEQDYDASSLDFYYYPPTRQGWKYGDREAMCVLFDLEEKQLTGSMKGSGR